MAFDAFEPIGTRVVPDLLALLTSLFYNVNRKPKSRPWLPQDVFADPLAPRRLSEREEAVRVGAVAADYRRLRAERLARAAQSVVTGDDAEGG
jgi:hypothetical protein